MQAMADDVAEFIEGFALMLNEAGMQRMAARVFGALLAAQSEGLTAKQIGEVLGVSPAAVSGAVGYSPAPAWPPASARRATGSTTTWSTRRGPRPSPSRPTDCTSWPAG